MADRSVSHNVLNRMTKLSARDQHETREAILRAAVELFAESGLNGASIAEIAKRAGVTKSLVMYYFPTKDELWRESVEVKLAPTMLVLEQFMADKQNVGLMDLVESRIKSYTHSPEICRMYAWTTLGHGNPIPEDKLHVAQGLIRKVSADPERYGVPEGVDAAMFVGVLMATVDGWFTYRSILSQLAGRNCETEQASIEFAKIVQTCFFPSLKKPESK